MMKTQELTLKFHTPAFLGNSMQLAQWRTPALKAQLRQWWRVAYVSQAKTIDLAKMRAAEGLLFGQVGHGPNAEASKSLLRLRLSNWSEGSLKSFVDPGAGDVHHPNVQRNNGNINALLYLGFGPLISKNGIGFKNSPGAAIKPGEEASLRLAYPDEHHALMQTALDLMNHYGTVGGRSRNGWGSFELRRSGESQASGLDEMPDLAACSKDWLETMKLDWPHAIGKDTRGPLVWQTQAHSDWWVVMRNLATLKIAIRTSMGMGKPSGPEDRHWLAYPVTNHTVLEWGKDMRLPNSLRFKVRRTAQGLVGVIFHMSHLPPQGFSPKADTVRRVWEKVHGQLDSAPQGPIGQVLQRVKV